MKYGPLYWKVMVAAGLLMGSSLAVVGQDIPVSQQVAERLQAMLDVVDGPDDVNIRPVATLDEPRYYCLDIPNAGDSLEGVEMSLHTCKDGMRHRDTIFSLARLDGGEIYMPDYELCVSAVALEPGVPVRLGRCSGDRDWSFENSRFTPQGADGLCLTVSPEGGELTRGGRTYPTRYKSRQIMLEDCSDELAERQAWEVVGPRKDLSGPMLPDGTPADMGEFARIIEENIRASGSR